MSSLRTLAIALALALIASGAPSARAAHRDVARTGLGDMTTTPQDIPRVARTGLGDMMLTPARIPRDAGRPDTTTETRQPVAAQTDRTPWLSIIGSLLLVTTLVVHYRLTRARRSAGTH